MLELIASTISIFLKKILRKIYHFILPYPIGYKLSCFLSVLASRKKNYIKKKRELLRKCQRSSKDTHLKILSDLGINYNILGRIWWNNFLFLRDLHDPKREETKKNLINYINDIDPSSKELRYNDFLGYYRLSLSFGHYDIACALRYKSSDIIEYQNKDHSTCPTERVTYLASLLEQGEYSRFSYQFFKEPITSRHKESLTQLYNILHGDNQSEKRVALFQSKEDQQYSQFIENKTVAIVGPMHVSDNDTKEIDSHDIIIRCNYCEKGDGDFQKTKGLRCDVTYFNGIGTSFLYSKKNLDWPTEITWAMCKNIDPKLYKKKIHTFFYKSEKNLLHLRTRKLKSITPVLYNGSLNAVPDIIFDILRFNPKSIYIFHADLMLTIRRFKGYGPWVANQKEVMSNSFIGHDPITQHCLLLRLWERKKISGDKYFQKVMNLSTQDYIQKLQEIYDPHGM